MCYMPSVVSTRTRSVCSLSCLVALLVRLIHLKSNSDGVKWTKELEVTPFVVNSAFCVRSNAFYILVNAQGYSASFWAYNDSLQSVFYSNPKVC